MTNMPPLTTIAEPDPALDIAVGKSDGLSVGQIALRAFLRPPLTKMALAFIVALLLLAVFVPFLANGRPYTLWVNGSDLQPGRREFPLFRALDRIDLIVLTLAFGAALFIALRKRLARTPLVPALPIKLLSAAGFAFALFRWTSAATYDLRGQIMLSASLLLAFVLLQLFTPSLLWLRRVLPLFAGALLVLIAIHCYRSWDFRPLGGITTLLSTFLLVAGMWFSRAIWSPAVSAVARISLADRRFARVLGSCGAVGLIVSFYWINDNLHINAGDAFLLLTAVALFALSIWAFLYADGLGWLVWAAILLVLLFSAALLRVESATPPDFLLLIAAASVIYAAAYHHLVDFGNRSYAWAFALLGLIALASLSIYTLKGDYLDPNGCRDYQALVDGGVYSHPVWAPLRWDYKDAEPLVDNLVFKDPSADHWLGTDGSGRDILARLLWSARVVMSIGFISVSIATTIGVIYGAFMGYFAGKTDLLGMRFVEIVEAIPTLFLIIIFVAIYGQQIFIIMVIIGLTSWTGIAHFVRAEFLKIRKQDFISAAIATGLPLRSVLFRHILPNGLTPVIVNTTFAVAGTVTIESGLSFLGLGIAPPSASWGLMLNEAGNPARGDFHPLMAISAGSLIFLTTFAYFIIGETLRDAIDPRLNKLA